MNSAYTAQNDINSFRSGLQSEHETFAAGLQNKQNSYLTHIANVKGEWVGKLNEAKGKLESAQELLKTGFESEAGIAGGAIAAKAAVHLKRVVAGTHDYRGNLTEKGKLAGQKNTASAQEENTNSPGENSGSGDGIAKPTGGSNTGEGSESGGGQSMEVRNNNMSSNQYTRDSYDPKTGLRGDPQKTPTYGDDSQGETKSDTFDDLTKDSPGDTKFDFDGPTMKTDPIPKTNPSDVGETKAPDTGGGGDGALGDSLDTGAKDLLDTGAKDLAEDAGSAATDAILDSAAAAFSWIPFVGEVLTGAAAVAGIVTAVAGGIDTIKAGAAEAADEVAAGAATAAAVAARPISTNPNFAGGYVAPAVSSIQT